MVTPFDVLDKTYDRQFPEKLNLEIFILTSKHFSITAMLLSMPQQQPINLS
jgi:hypothetical protein